MNGVTIRIESSNNQFTVTVYFDRGFDTASSAYRAAMVAVQAMTDLGETEVSLVKRPT
ncbi:hypothetical protein [Candidatus Magnetaquiglobus chichijimensis]|uniref:hypothetical protein n=1 Tax=Candidatus Magnetaquiglobus chichijimensis TaxID=3141448 RepID=UPI003B978A62